MWKIEHWNSATLINVYCVTSKKISYLHLENYTARNLLWAVSWSVPNCSPSLLVSSQDQCSQYTVHMQHFTMTYQCQQCCSLQPAHWDQHSSPESPPPHPPMTFEHAQVLLRTKTCQSNKCSHHVSLGQTHILYSSATGRSHGSHHIGKLFLLCCLSQTNIPSQSGGPQQCLWESWWCMLC